MIQKKLHPTKKLGAPCKTKKGKLDYQLRCCIIYVRLRRIIVRQPAAESPNKSLPLVVASPALQQPPATQQLPCIQLTIQPPSVEESPMQQGVALLSTSTGDDDYAPPIEEEVDIPVPSDNLDEDAMAPLCAACQLCCNPNSNTDGYCFCMNCNGESHTICTKQMNFQTPALDKLIISPRDFCYMWKEHYKKTPKSHRQNQNVVFCFLCKA